MSSLRLPLYALCFILTLTLVQCSDLALWQYPSPFSWTLGGLETARGTGDRIPQQSQSPPPPPSFAERSTAALQPGNSFGETTSKSSQGSLASFLRRSSSPDWIPLLKENRKGILDKQVKSKLVNYNPQTSELHRGRGALFGNNLDNDSYDVHRYPFSEQNFGRISRRRHRTQNQRQIQTERRSFLPPLHSYDPSGGLFLSLLPYIRSRPQRKYSGMVSPMALSRLNRSTAHARDDGLVLCREDPLSCYRRRQAMALTRYFSHRKRNKISKPYLLGGALGRR
ncbi:hypothetical protein ElyMa_005733300 [Elysia marginata]|uniref:Uncharacterized protein n=1 Tax=Elysia marginata TaxID=1093978 RepID=A0AAV4FJG5_9GAST|nr:hypothetical protein ElyMa_005733300 [Elysia marginata]